MRRLSAVSKDEFATGFLLFGDVHCNEYELTYFVEFTARFWYLGVVVSGAKTKHQPRLQQS
jgi:hypothetical protein